MKLDDIIQMAQELGAKGMSFDDFVEDKAIGDAFMALDAEDGLDLSASTKIEEAFRAAQVAFRGANGWIIGWTTAPASYDQFGTKGLESFEWSGATLRKVVMNPDHADAQMTRYLGGGPAWNEDPRIDEARTEAKLAHEKDAAEEHRKLREYGLVWIQTADLSVATNEDTFDKELRARGLQWGDLRAEEERRREEQANLDRVGCWVHYRALFADGCTIVDPGRAARSTPNGCIPSRPVIVYRSVRVEPNWTCLNSVDDALVFDNQNREVDTLRHVGDRLIAGELRVAAEDEHIPPHPVLTRLRPSSLGDVTRVEVFGRVVWVGREFFASTPIVLDGDGKLVRAKKVVEIALRTAAKE